MRVNARVIQAFWGAAFCCLPVWAFSVPMTLHQAIDYALMHNPQLQIDYNSRKLQRYTLLIAQDAFHPKFSINASSSYNRMETSGTGQEPGALTTKEASIGPGVTWTLPLGTVLSASTGYSPSWQSGSGSQSVDGGLSRGGVWTVGIEQPLLNGFGVAINEASLYSAQDQQAIDSYQLEDDISHLILQVTQDYYAVVQASQSLRINQAMLNQDQKQLNNRQKLFQAGRIPQESVTQSEIDIGTQQLALSQASQALSLARQKLSADLGLPNQTRFDVDSHLSIQEIHPKFSQALSLALHNDRDLKADKLSYQESLRAIGVSENSRLWNLDLDVTRSRSLENTSNPISIPNFPTSENTISDNTMVSLTLSIPLDQLSMDQKSLSSAIAAQNAQLSLQNTERTLRSTVQSQVQNLESAWQQLTLSKRQWVLTQQSVRSAAVQFQYGKMDAFTFSEQQASLVNAKLAVISAEINYMTQVMNYQAMTGTLLPLWGVHLERN